MEEKKRKTVKNTKSGNFVTFLLLLIMFLLVHEEPIFFFFLLGLIFVNKQSSRWIILTTFADINFCRMIHKMRKCDLICPQNFIPLNQRNWILEILTFGDEKSSNLKIDWTKNLQVNLEKNLRYGSNMFLCFLYLWNWLLPKVVSKWRLQSQ